jgi:hypothetical protein
MDTDTKLETPRSNLRGNIKHQAPKFQQRERRTQRSKLDWVLPAQGVTKGKKLDCSTGFGCYSHGAMLSLRLTAPNCVMLRRAASFGGKLY